MKTESEGRRQNDECRSGEKLGSGIRAQSLGCRGLRQLWRNRERRQIVESAVTVRREVLRTVYVRRVVEREGVSKCLTVRYLISPGGCRKAAVHAATFSHFRHIEPSSGWVGCRRGEETAPCLGCLRRLPPEGLNERNTFFICYTDERGSGLAENLRLFSLIFAYLRLMGKKC